MIKRLFITLHIFTIFLMPAGSGINLNVSAFNDPVQEDYGLKVGEIAPNFTLQSLTGETITLKDFVGKKIVLNFWASWCLPCREEMPAMQNVYEQYQSENVEIIAVNLTAVREKISTVKAFTKELGITFPILLDEKGDVLTLYEILPIPTTYFIDTNGVIQAKHFGPMSEDYLIEQINKLP